MARARAFEALFEAEFERITSAAALRRGQLNQPLDEPEHAYAQAIVDGVNARLDEIDAIVRETATQRPLTQMALVDLTVLRIALWELLFNTEAVRATTAANEAVELAKRFGSDGSRRLVSGVLGTIRRTRLAEPVQEASAVALFDRIQGIIEEQLSVERSEITMDASFIDDLGADSLDLVELIMSFEEEFRDEVPELEISDEDAEGIGTVRDAVTFLMGKGVPE